MTANEDVPVGLIKINYRAVANTQILKYYSSRKLLECPKLYIFGYHFHFCHLFSRHFRY